MCRSIKVLRERDVPASDEEIAAASSAVREED